MRTLIIIFICTINNYSFGQEIKRNNVFSVGFYPPINLDFNDNLKIDTFFNNQSPWPIIGYGGSNICDTKGKLQIMCNGFDLYNGNGFILKNWEIVNSPFGVALYKDNSWAFWNQMSTIIPKANNQYYVFTSGMSDKAYWDWKTGTTDDDLYFDHLCYHVVDMDANNRQGEVVSKNNILMKDAFLCYDKMACVQHGNGKDWWLVKPHKKLHKFYLFYITENSITLADSTDYLNGTINMNQIKGQSVFSEDGTQYAFVSENYLVTDSNFYYYNFDRCTGKFSNYRKFIIPTNRNYSAQQNGVAFSPNGRFLYVCHRREVGQIDLWNPDNRNYIELYGPDSIGNPFEEFLNLKLAPDGKIYIGNKNAQRGWSYIANPDEFGLASNYVHKGLVQNLTYLTIPPNNPKFGMGALKGSLCDTIRAQPLAWLLYPNPALEFIKIKVPNSTNNQKLEIAIYDAVGRLVTKQIQFINFEHEATINLPNMARGVYIIKCVKDREEFISKFVKQ